MIFRLHIIILDSNFPMHKLVNIVKWDKSIGIGSNYEDEVQAAVMKFMVGCKYKCLVSLHDPCPYWRERGENYLSFTPTHYGCTFYYKSSVPEIWPLKNRRQLPIILFKEQKQCLVLYKELRIKTFPSIFKNIFSEYSWKLQCVYVYICIKSPKIVPSAPILAI